MCKITFRFQHGNLEQSEAHPKTADSVPETGCHFYIRAPFVLLKRILGPVQPQMIQKPIIWGGQKFNR